MRISGLVALLVPLTSAVMPGAARAQEAPDAARSSGQLVEAGVAVGLPSALPASLSTGVSVGWTQALPRCLEWGLRASWVRTSESTEVWSVTHADLRLRATAAVHHTAGRGSMALRLALGPTLVHETRDRNQGMRAGLTGSALQTSAWATLPAVDLELVVAIRVAGPWALIVDGGPSVDRVDGRLRGGWIAGVGAGWQR